MQPGDLVFVAGEYYKPKGGRGDGCALDYRQCTCICHVFFPSAAKKQKHNMVHVEIWVGDGEKTLGARWQRGRSEALYHRP